MHDLGISRIKHAFKSGFRGHFACTVRDHYGSFLLTNKPPRPWIRVFGGNNQRCGGKPDDDGQVGYDFAYHFNEMAQRRSF
jgi:hypothetical protein